MYQERVSVILSNVWAQELTPEGLHRLSKMVGRLLSTEIELSQLKEQRQRL